MKKIMLVVSLFSFTALAQGPRIELGLGSGVTQGFAGEAFKDNTKSGDAQDYWLGYGLNQNFGVELGFDHFDFDGVNTDHQLIYLAGVYRWMPEVWVHPLAKLGLGSLQSKNFAGDKTNSLGAKAALGLEADFKYISFGALLNYQYMQKAGDADLLKNAQAVVPMLFITFHNALESSSAAKTSVQSTPPPAVVVRDSDADGISDEEDKCPNTASGVVVNKFGCAEKETASVKLNVEFASGKTNLDAKFGSEIAELASFMKKFPETTVEIAGYTDNKGAQQKNQILSQKRAEAVKTALAKAGIESHRLTAKGYGQQNPVADNKTEEGRSQNRRVVAHISVQTDKKK